VIRGIVALCLLGVLAPSGAEEPAPPLTRAELAACLVDEQEVRTRNAALDARKQALTAKLAEIQALEAGLDATKATLDESDVAAVGAFNASIDEHARLAAEYNEALPAINADIESLNAKRRELDARCAHRAYDERDMAALRKSTPQ
jgi:septal ring factor EnvC (AmiA/AmiB activator)